MTLAPHTLKGKRSFATLYCSNLYKSGKLQSSIYTSAGVPADGYLNDIAEPGSLCVDTTNKTLYQNSGTKAATNWDNFTTASGTGAFTGTFDGAVGSVTPAAAIATTIESTDTSDSSASNVGALKTAGGLGVAKKAFIGTDLHVGTSIFASVAAGLTAHSGGGQGSALALTKDLNQVSTSGADTDSVKMPVALPGMFKLVANDDSAQNIVIFPATGETIDGAGANAGVVLGEGGRALFVCLVAGNWTTMAMGAKLTAA